MVDVHNDHRSAEASKEAQGIDLDLVPIVLFVFLMCNLNQQEVGVGCHLGLGVNLRLEAFFEFLGSSRQNLVPEIALDGGVINLSRRLAPPFEERYQGEPIWCDQVEKL